MGDIPVVTLENEQITVQIMTGLGATIRSIVYKPTGVEFLTKLKGSDRIPLTKQPGPALHPMFRRFIAGWKDLVPQRAMYGTYLLPPERVGISSFLNWKCEIKADTEDVVSIRCSADIPEMPVRAEKTFTLRKDSAVLEMRDKVVNLGTEDAYLAFTQHCAFGEPFLSESLKVALPDAKVFKIDQCKDGANTVLSDYSEPMECVTFESGTKRSLYQTGAKFPEDRVFLALYDLADRETDLYQPALKTGAKLKWDLKDYPYIRYWFQSGEQSYALGIEPSNDCFNDILVSAIKECCSKLVPGDSWESQISFEAYTK